MVLSARTVSCMKWRTAFLTLAVLGVITFGPRLRRGAQEQQFRSRSLLETEEGAEAEDGKSCLEREDTSGCCNPRQEWPEYPYKDDDDVTMLKLKLKRFARQHDNPGSIAITCLAGSVLGDYCTNIPKDDYGNTVDYVPGTEMRITVDDCRTQTWMCVPPVGPARNATYEASEGDDAMFPTDAFTEAQRGSGGIILHIIGILYMFYALALVCDHYFVPTLDVIIATFKISDDVAGATFMAAGGSAPELFTSIIGVFIAVSDVGIGTIVGSAVFNVLFVIAACAFASATALKLTAWPLIRDTTFYSIALVVLVIFFLDDKIEWYEALILFLWYFCYVIFMKFNAGLEERFLQTFPGLRKEGEADEKKGGGFYGARGGRKPLLALMRGKVQTRAEETEMKAPGVGLEGLKMQLQNGEEDVEAKEPLKVEEEKEEEPDEPYEDYVRAGPGEGMVSKVMWGLSLPLMIPMWITIPDPQDKAREKYFPIAFLVSILWIAIFSYFMVWWATLAGVTLGISDAVMGLTFLAAGTSVPDLITSVLVAKEGKGDMAVSSSIGSNLFDVTVGLPVPWLLYTIIFGRAMEVNSVGIGCSIGMLFVMLLLVFASIIVFKWEMTKPMGGIMLVLYVIFVIVSLGLSECWFICPF